MLLGWRPVVPSRGVVYGLLRTVRIRHGASGEKALGLMSCPDCQGSGRVIEECGACWSGLQDCYSCNGTGYYHYDEYIKDRCSECRGTGRTRCTNCNGRGEYRKACSTCAATGYLPAEQVRRIVSERLEAQQKKEAEEAARQAEEVTRRAEEARKRKEQEKERFDLETKYREEAARRHRLEQARIARETQQRLDEERRIQAENARVDLLKATRIADGRCVLCGRKFSVIDKIRRRMWHSGCRLFQG